MVNFEVVFTKDEMIGIFLQCDLNKGHWLGKIKNVGSKIRIDIKQEWWDAICNQKKYNGLQFLQYCYIVWSRKQSKLERRQKT